MDWSEIVSLGATLLAAVTQATLQVGLGTELLIYHDQLRKSDRLSERLRELVSHFVSGIYILTALVLAAIGFFIYCGLGGFGGGFGKMGTNGNIGVAGISLIAAGLIALAVLSWLFYYKIGKTTELWLPRSITRYLDRRAKKTDSGVEAFSLGILAGLAEMPFSLVLMLAAGFNLAALPAFLQPAVVLLYALIVVIPETIVRFAVRSGSTVVDIQRFRVKNKLFLKILTGALFLVLAVYIIVFQIA